MNSFALYALITVKGYSRLQWMINQYFIFVFLVILVILLVFLIAVIAALVKFVNDAVAFSFTLSQFSPAFDAASFALSKILCLP